MTTHIKHMVGPAARHNALGDDSTQALADLEAPALAHLCVAGAELGAAQQMTSLNAPARPGLRRLHAHSRV
jgi:hypothetical protein